MYMIWHLRYSHDPAHSWLRSALEAAVPQALAAADDGIPAV
jgi:hypothetical protein